MGVKDHGYDDGAGNPNSVAGTEEIELFNIGFSNRQVTLSNNVVPFDICFMQQYIRLVWFTHSS